MNPDFVKSQGRQVAAFHRASKQYAIDHPEEVKNMELAAAIDSILSAIVPPKIEKNEETFGIIHGDMHEGNYLFDPENDNCMTLFDWDATGRNFYAIDLGTLVISK